MSENETITVSRDVNTIVIPDGHHSTLAKGTVVTIQQALGDSYTVVTDYGNMLRISGADADALGKERLVLAKLTTETDPEAVEKNCWEVMKTVFDPEIPVNIVDLGLVYHCKVTAAGEGINDVYVTMTLTAPGCGMGPIIQNDVERSIKALAGVDNINVEVVLDPPWSQDMMSDIAKVQLNLL